MYLVLGSPDAEGADFSWSCPLVSICNARYCCGRHFLSSVNSYSRKWHPEEASKGTQLGDSAPSAPLPAFKGNLFM